MKHQVELITTLPTIADGIPEWGIVIANGIAMCKTTAVAEMFGKRHDHVVRDVEVVEAEAKDAISPPKSGEPNPGQLNLTASTSNNLPKSDGIEDELLIPVFKRSTYIDSRGKKQKEYLLDEVAFALVVMKYGGVTATRIKLRILTELHRAKHLIATRLQGKSSYRDACSTGCQLGMLSTPIEFAAETNMIYTVVLGDKASRLKSRMGLPPNGSIRDNLSEGNLDRLDRAHILDGELMRAGMDHYQRADIVRRAINP